MEKNYRLFLFLVLLFTSLASPAQSPKFGYMNSAILLADIPEMKQADNELKSFQTQLTKEGQEMVKSLQDRTAELQSKQVQGEISPKEQEVQALKFENERASILKYEQEVHDKLAKKREELYKPILDKVNRSVQAVAKENGYKLIFEFNTNILLYAEEYLDVTGLVKAKLGL